MVKLEIFIRVSITKVLHRLSNTTKKLKIHYITNICNTLAKKINIDIYDDKSFLQYVINKHSFLCKNINSIETIALRDSTADYGFNPKYFPNSFNLGLTSLDLHFTYLQYKSILKDAKSLKNIILFASFPMIGHRLSKTTERNRLIAYHSVFKIPSPSNYSFNKRYIKYIQRKLKTIKPSISESYRGYKSNPAPISGAANIQHRIKSHTRENKRVPDQLSWLEKIIVESQKNEHNLFIVLPPCRQDYKDNMPLFKEGYKKLFSINFENSQVIDFYNNEVFDDSDFLDTDHLNEKGAKKLTQELYTIISKQ